METAEAAIKSYLETFNKAKLKQLNELRKENEFCDLTLKCEDGFEIKVHRHILSSASNYFKDLLTLSMKEKFEECISLPDITGDVLEKIIMFIYTSEFEEEIEDVEKIIKYAVIFQLQELVEIYSILLSESITDNNCLKYWRFAKNNLISSLEDKCISYIASQADHLFESSLMSDLTMEEMKSLLADNRLHLQCDEKEIFEYVWKWAEGKVSASKNFSQVFLEVVALIHISKLEIEFVFQKMFGTNEDVLANTELLNKICKLTKQKHEDEVPSRLVFSKPTQRRLIGLASNKMYIGLGEENIIEKEVNLRLGFGYTTFDNKLLICGGEDSNSCEFFDPSAQQWKKFPFMRTGKKWHQCLNLDNKIYACGGIDSKTVEIFDLGEGKWDYGPEMPRNNCNFGLTGVNGALYTIGGDSYYSAYRLDPRTQAWSRISYSPYIGYVRCVSIGPCIYCFTVDKRRLFDTRSNKFSEEILTGDYGNHSSICELNGYFHYLGYLEQGDTWKYSLNHIQYHLDGKQGFKESYGLHTKDETSNPAIVSLYY